MPSPAPFVIDPYLTGIAIGYSNPAYIADLVMPRIPVGKKDYRYLNYNKNEEFKVPNNLIGRRGRAQQVELTATETSGACLDYGLADGVPQDDIDNAPPNYKPLDRAVLKLSDYNALAREVRVSGIVTATASYASGFSTTLSGSSQWSDPTCDAVASIATGLDLPLMRPNTLVLGRQSWTALRSNPAINKAVNKTGGDKGLVTRQAVADLFELDQVLVGESWQNTANLGQTGSFARIWGKHAAVLYINKMADNMSGITFGWTAQFGDKVAYQRPNADIGLRGGVEVKAGETVDEKVVANDCGYLWRNASA